MERKQTKFDLSQQKIAEDLVNSVAPADQMRQEMEAAVAEFTGVSTVSPDALLSQKVNEQEEAQRAVIEQLQVEAEMKAAEARATEMRNQMEADMGMVQELADIYLKEPDE